LDTQPDIVSPEDTKHKKAVRGDIEFKNVFFAYNNKDYVLKNVSFSLKAGESVAVVGHTGAGKTSLINILGRQYLYQSGDITIDQQSITEWRLSELRREMAIVLQDVFLFSGTIRDNIRMGDESITDETIEWALRQVNAHHFVDGLPKKYDSLVKERGATLSLGQKQLLAFARALVRNPRILILDEATSSVDTETEYYIQDALKKLMKDRTSLIIAHRLSTIKHVNRIIVMHRGSVREIGTHTELMEQQGLYYQLYELQYKYQELSFQSPRSA
jgi:ATP-binding cassette subfamily B protein